MGTASTNENAVLWSAGKSAVLLPVFGSLPVATHRPTAIVAIYLDSPSNDWDAVLAVKLLDECHLGTHSRLYGYCSLLTRSANPTSSTAGERTDAQHGAQRPTELDHPQL